MTGLRDDGLRLIPHRQTHASYVPLVDDMAVPQSTREQLVSTWRALADADRWRPPNALAYFEFPDIQRSAHFKDPFRYRIQPADNFFGKIQTLISDMSMFRNAFAPVSHLPQEVVLEVFVTIRDSTPNVQWITVTHVSRDWRNIAIGYSPLWTCIDLPSPSAREFIRRSRTSPLTVRVAQPHLSHSDQSLLGTIVQSGALKALSFLGSQMDLQSLMRTLGKCSGSMASPTTTPTRLHDMRLALDPEGGSAFVKLRAGYGWTFIQPLTVLHLSGWMPSRLLDLFGACPALRELRLDMQARPWGILNNQSRRSHRKANPLFSDTPSWLQLLPELRILYIANAIILSNDNHTIIHPSLVQLDLLDEADLIEGFLDVLTIPSTCHTTIRILPSSEALDNETAPVRVWAFLRKCHVERQLDTVIVAHVIGGVDTLDTIEVTFMGKAGSQLITFPLDPARHVLFFDLYAPGVCSFAFRKLVCWGPAIQGFEKDEESRWPTAFAALTADVLHIKGQEFQPGFAAAFNDKDFLGQVETLVIEGFHFTFFEICYPQEANTFRRQLSQRLSGSSRLSKVVLLRCEGGGSMALVPGVEYAPHSFTEIADFKSV